MIGYIELLKKGTNPIKLGFYQLRMQSLQSYRRVIQPLLTRWNIQYIRFESTKTSTESTATKALPESSVPHGTVLKGINFMKGSSDPIAKPDREYPDWLFQLLEPKKEENDVFSRLYQRKKNKEAIKARNFLKKK